MSSQAGATIVSLNSTFPAFGVIGCWWKLSCCTVGEWSKVSHLDVILGTFNSLSFHIGEGCFLLRYWRIIAWRDDAGHVTCDIAAQTGNMKHVVKLIGNPFVFFYRWYFFDLLLLPMGSGPILEVLQYQANPWQGWSKLLTPRPVPKISLISKTPVGVVSDIKLIRTDTTLWS